MHLHNPVCRHSGPSPGCKASCLPWSQRNSTHAITPCQQHPNKKQNCDYSLSSQFVLLSFSRVLKWVLPFSREVESAADSENEKEREGNSHASDYEYWLKKEIDKPLGRHAAQLISRHAGQIIPIEVVKGVRPIHPVGNVGQETNRGYYDARNMNLTQSCLSPLRTDCIVHDPVNPTPLFRTVLLKNVVYGVEICGKSGLFENLERYR